MEVTIYTDGSCHTQNKNGAWVTILFINADKIVLSGKEKETTHNRMELMAVLKAIEYVKENLAANTVITIYSDSQYVVDLPARKDKLIASDFVTKKGNELTNSDLLKSLFSYLNEYAIKFIKVKAHQKRNDVVNYNIEADILSRKLVREN